VGGATVSLYADRMAEEVRPTDDVDILIEIYTHQAYAAIDEQLRKIGFVNDQQSGIICRYTIQGIIVDIMPTGENVFGFSNRWHTDGFKQALDYIIDDDVTVKIFPAPYFIASKLEAFKSPGRRDSNNGLYSSDFEDIIFVLENRASVWNELDNAPADVKTYLQHEFLRLQQNPLFEEWVAGHAGFGSPPATYYILESLEEFTNFKDK
jgi:predicted nucleotidyltransferase